MVQIGNLHVGKAQIVEKPNISVLEAGLLWDLTTSRYKCVEETRIYLNHAHDDDLKQVLRTGLQGIVEPQLDALEKQMDKYKIPLPSRPPKSVSTVDNSSTFSDQFLIKQVFEGCQRHIDYLASVSRSMVFNDSLRQMVYSFLQDEFKIYNNLCRYVKTRGFIEPPPMYEPQ